MQPLISILFPPDPPMAPMTFSRLPIVQRFWMGGIVAAVVGFGLGFLLWSWQLGLVPMADAYFNAKHEHARIQILLFAGSFLLGFALQSGPHVVGGQPPSSKLLLRLLPPLWIGFFLTLISQPTLTFIGNGLMSLTYLGAATFLLSITLHGDPSRRLSRGFPLAASFLPLAIAPWLPLDSAEMALMILWCGPMTSALVAGQQLIQNVLGGSLIQGRIIPLFILALFCAWFLSITAVFTSWGSWQFAGIAWLVVLSSVIVGTHLLSATWHYGLNAINVTLFLGFAIAFACALLLLLEPKNLPQDAVLHLLGAGVIAPLIFGVVTRVAGFFSGCAVLNDRLLVYLLFLWSLVVATRSLTPLGWVSSSDWTWAMIIIGSSIVLLWSFRAGLRLWQINQQISPELR